MRILLTGGAGFIGSHIAILLLQGGHEVVILDSFVNSSNNVIKAIKFFFDNDSIDFKLKIVIGDIREKRIIDNLFKVCIKEGRPIQAVIHLAGLKSVSESVIKPLYYWDVNVFGTKNLLEIMSKNHCYTMVFSSSATVYGSPEFNPISEDQKVSPFNPYGNTKVAIENMFSDLYKSNMESWRICSLRYFNPVGAHPSGLLGEDPIGIPNNLFPFIYQVAIGRRSFLKVFGDDWNTKDGSGVRDYIHIMDLSEGHIKAIDYLNSKKSCYEFINLGSGKGYSVFQIISEFEFSTGCKIPFSIDSRREGDVAICYADITKANNLLDWSPKRSLNEICLDGWNWQKRNPNGYV
tara:strand:+ start:1409 stop:2455 length:1047 start_codon:yes stop_codon:yes gene_type:complete